jgi:pimeloyl-ACP methyl ester carboxylesterase
VTNTAVTSADGVRIAVREAGPRQAPPIVLLHGWAQSSAVWAEQLASAALADRFRLIAADLRGHGDSDVPEHGYRDSDAWAGDVAALLAYAGAEAVVVGWSYGGLVATDYLRRHGTDAVAGLVLVGAITEIGRDRPGGRVGPVMRAALPAALDEDPAVAVPALLEFTTGLAAGQVSGELAQRLLGTALRVPPRVRAELFRRDVTSGDVLAAVDVPTLVLHGGRDAVVDPSVAEYAAGAIPGAELRWFDGTGHLPFVERAAEFTRELAVFAEGCAAVRRLGTGTGAPAAGSSAVESSEVVR